MEFCKVLLLLSSQLILCYGGDLTVAYAPESLRFVQASSLRASSLDDVLAVAMGYTPETTPWTGLSVTSPFNSPKACVVVTIDGGGSELRQEGDRYNLQEDIAMSSVFDALNASVSSNAFSPVHFVRMEVADGAEKGAATILGQSLVATKEPDASFLLEVSTLPTLITKLQSAMQHKGQDFLFLELESFSRIVKTYGDDSAQVREGKQLLSDAIDKLVMTSRRTYEDSVLVVSVVTDSLRPLTRRTRAADEVTTSNVNLAAEYDEDFPAIFNIILWMSIILVITTLAITMAMAYMDPGRDSIIYRMTNPRMKKEQ